MSANAGRSIADNQAIDADGTSHDQQQPRLRQHRRRHRQHHPHHHHHHHHHTTTTTITTTTTTTTTITTTTTTTQPSPHPRGRFAQDVAAWNRANSGDGTINHNPEHESHGGPSGGGLGTAAAGGYPGVEVEEVYDLVEPFMSDRHAAWLSQKSERGLIDGLTEYLCL